MAYDTTSLKWKVKSHIRIAWVEEGCRGLWMSKVAPQKVYYTIHVVRQKNWFHDDKLELFFHKSIRRGIVERQ